MAMASAGVASRISIARTIGAGASPRLLPCHVIALHLQRTAVAAAMGIGLLAGGCATSSKPAVAPVKPAVALVKPAVAPVKPAVAPVKPAVAPVKPAVAPPPSVSPQRTLQPTSSPPQPSTK